MWLAVCVHHCVVNTKKTAVKRSALDYFPDEISLPSLKKASADCKGCDIYKLGGPTVFGEGPADAEIMFVGEVPGDEEDKMGRPFVGPAGRLLNEALEEVGIASVFM